MVTKALTDVNTLGDVPVDNMLATIDVERERLPAYTELYDRWERQHWTVQELDFTADKAHWDAMDPMLQQSRVRSFIGFLHGEVAVTDTLHPYAIAAPRADQRLFLTTQIVDEARHAVFFHRFMTEVVGLPGDSMEQLLEETRDVLAPTFRLTFDHHLVEASQRILREPKNLDALVEGVVIYHLLIENTLALASQRSMLAQYRRHDILPGFRAGFMAVTRDESRHVLFGMTFLRDAMRDDPRQQGVIMESLDKWLPNIMTSFQLTPEMRAAIIAQGVDPNERREFAKLSLRKKLNLLNLPMHPLAVADTAEVAAD